MNNYVSYYHRRDGDYILDIAPSGEIHHTPNRTDAARWCVMCAEELPPVVYRDYCPGVNDAVGDCYNRCERECMEASDEQ